MRMMKRTFLAGVSALGIAYAGVAMAAGVTDADLLNDATNTKQVVTNGMGLQGHRFSPLTQINTTNVKDLVPAWSLSFGGEKQRGQEAQALVHDGVVYVTASYSRLFAMDAKTGDKLWEFDARLPEGIMPCCDVINRGAALYGDKVYFGTLDARIYALNAKTGKVVWHKTIDDFKAGYSYSAAPLVIPTKANGTLIVTGVSGGEFGVVGRVEARNADTGALVWSRPVLEGLMGTYKGKDSTMTGKKNETWPGDMYKTGGGAPWMGGTYDPETKLIFIGTGNPAPWNSWTRPGDNRWTSSRLAINPENGEIVWGFQTTPHDGWDFDGVNEFIPFDAKMGGKEMKLGATADRNGFFYVLDRTDGKFIHAMPFVSKITWAKGIDKNGRPIYNEDSRPGDPSKSADGKKGKEVFNVPSFLGGKNQMPVSYDDQTGLFYVPSNEWGMDIHNEPVVYKKGAAYLGAGFNIKPVFEDHIGSLKAIDPIAMKVIWEYKNKAPLWGGVLSTAGGLVFTGTPEGYLMAFDAKTGAVLWKFNVGTGIVAPPITWDQDGVQMVGVAAGWGGAVPLWGGEVAKTFKGIDQGGSYWAFKLASSTAAK
ncbi:PQQ-dependent methanol/ethanol family dehydrogenase [Rhodoblastus acidophilus]|uniref:PQQ-dependent methanol/ethanol family dehydrogenase n=1 Tax=Candidatus Rhodoblastus alkanivorans TaxID=2954117 RepID=A0ABS9Z4Y9_9HYPH|nr:PQQ-dependent methanol/ethanol family dehydrogenase [Candidatus Rhodoblastus alkanivorans]MCI4679898.1 PQQ-dependent methanol/ethanol family dehydrogenase [Candidatus Rhodoblastus alkanivorans]MCI4682699.1 PQQ-dependent methanol/ethanol family dehydrogenase [Candidatus Rhodoblastus alkanivorans]MDI4640006.1 PQQ-dependent methanol/ethanol family dehydrogenase [Rhodoblastus acidophilus]